jgi:folate-binding protein YgfZ
MTGPDLEGYAALRSTAAVYRPARDVLSVSGPDSVSYLQGQCSQDVAALQPGQSAESLLLSPQGKVETYLRLTLLAPDHFVIDTDQGFGAVVTARLERFRLRTKVTIEALEWICVAVRGPASGEALIGKPEVVAAVEWPGFSGFDLLGPEPVGGLGEWVDDRVVRCGDGAWEAARIEAGVPVNGREVVEGSIAAELGLVDRTVSFTKGCFTGQELVARIDSRGSNVARRLCGVVVGSLPGGSPPTVGATAVTPDGAHEVGHLSSVAWSPGWEATVALATLHRRVTPPEDVVVRWDDGDGSHSVLAGSTPLPFVPAGAAAPAEEVLDHPPGRRG